MEQIEEEELDENSQKLHRIGKYTIVKIVGDEQTILTDQTEDNLLYGVGIYKKGDYIGIFSGDYLLLSNGVISGNQVYYDAEEAVNHPRTIRNMKKRVRQIHYEDFNSMGSMLYDIIKYQASTEGFLGAGRLTGISSKLKVIRQRFLKIFSFWSERIIY